MKRVQWFILVLTVTNAIAINQLFLAKALTAAIFESVTGYAERGQPDTTFANDSVLSTGRPVTRPRLPSGKNRTPQSGSDGVPPGPERDFAVGQSSRPWFDPEGAAGRYAAGRG